MTTIEWDICNGVVSNSRIKYLEDIIGIKFPKTFTEIVNVAIVGIPKKMSLDILMCFSIDHFCAVSDLF